MESNIHKLIDKYFEGETTLDEERTIAEYLHSQAELPEDLKPLKAMFDFADAQRSVTSPAEPIAKHKTSTRKPLWSNVLVSMVSGAAAAVIIMVIGFKLNMSTTETTTPVTQQPSPEIVCHVNGQLVTDNTYAMVETNRVLDDVFGDVNLAMAEVKRLNILYK